MEKAVDDAIWEVHRYRMGRLIATQRREAAEKRKTRTVISMYPPMDEEREIAANLVADAGCHERAAVLEIVRSRVDADVYAAIEAAVTRHRGPLKPNAWRAVWTKAGESVDTSAQAYNLAMTYVLADPRLTAHE